MLRHHVIFHPIGVVCVVLELSWDELVKCCYLHTYILPKYHRICYARVVQSDTSCHDYVVNLIQPL